MDHAPIRFILSLVILTGGLGFVEAARDELPRIAEKTRGMTPRDGLLRFHVDDQAGKIWLELPAPSGPRSTSVELLYVEGLRTGLGSNPVGLDRGQLGSTRWVAFRRVGPRVLLEQLNPGFRALDADLAEARATQESFATSILWGTKIAALDPDGRSLIDLTSFLVRDAHAVAERLANLEEGTFSLDPDRSAVDTTACLAFPDNLELEAILTYGGSKPGRHVRRTVPTADSITLVQHHSFIRLPDNGYRPRSFDPRAGSFAIGFKDYAAELDEPMQRSWIVRHRLEKTDPAAQRSPVVQPIVYHVDPGTPEPVRSALIDGARWWAAAFDAAGFVDAFRVELLPEDAHPLDVRYNVIQWVHRSTRGWSYGGGITDPRTGERLKGHVSLGSLRVRQDRLLFEGLAGTEKTDTGDADDPIQLALARIRQLSAHEVGHALGLSHNFAASTYADRASVMDYPAPLIRFDDAGELDFSEAYGVGVGDWDRHAVRYAYSEFPGGADEDAELEAIVREGLDAGLVFLTDADARPAGASDPRANLWDNGDDPVEALRLTLRVRRHALERFGETNLLPGRPLAYLQEVLAPVYFHHRYQLDAAVKLLGGMEYHYALRGDGQVPTRIVAPARQREALEALLALLDPRELDLPESVLRLLAPRPADEPRNREMFASGTSPAFDLEQAAATAATLVIDGVLQPERLARMVDFRRRDPAMPGVDELLDRLITRVFDPAPTPPRQVELARTVRSVLVHRLIDLTRRSDVRVSIRARSEASLAELLDRIESRRPVDASDPAHDAYLTAEISRFLDRPADASAEGWSPAAPPPGSPIGATEHLGDCAH